MKLIALKRVRYPRGGALAREHGPGQEFEAPDNDADLLIRLKLARAGENTVSPSIVDLPKSAPKKVAEETGERDERSELQAEYKALIGKKPFHGWDAERLRAEMAEYRTTAMRGNDLQNKSMKADD